MPLFDRPPVHNFPDRAFREALEQVQNLRDALLQAVPDIAPYLDYDHARYIKPAFLLEDWRGRESDLLCLIPYCPPGMAQGDPVLICVLLEHQSRPDAHLPLRILLYAVLFWEQQWKEYERRHEPGAALRLTPVVPIVFHTGDQEWSGNRSLADLFDGPEALRVYAPQWPLVFWDLALRTPEALLASDGPFAQFLAVVRAEASDAERFLQVYTQLMERLEPVAGQDKMRWRDLLWLALSWCRQRRPEDEQDALIHATVESQRNTALREEARSVSETTKQTWAQAVEARAARIGQLRQGRETLIALLSDAFGELPETLKASIESCDDLDRLLTATLQTRTLRSLDQFTL
jgi:hypothetical protein